MKLTDEEKGKMKLLLIGDSNWNYYLDGEVVFAVAKADSGSEDCVFGNKKYFAKYVRNEQQRDDRIEGRLTALGYEISGIDVLPVKRAI